MGELWRVERDNGQGDVDMRFRLTVILAALYAVLALSAVAATAAQAAVEGPIYNVGKTRLKAESTEITAKANTIFEFTLHEVGRTVTMQCKKQSYAAGAKITGSNGANSATGEATVLFSECTVANDGTPCSVENIKTVALKSELVFLNATRTGILGIRFAPATGSEFARVKLVGTGCKESEFSLDGSLAGQDASGGKVVEAGKEPAEAVTNEMYFPSTQIKTVFPEVEGALVEEKAGLTYFGVLGASLSGKSALELVSKSVWGVFDH